MATIRRRKNSGKYQVQVRIKGQRPWTGSFDTEREALIKARDVEAKLRANIAVVSPRDSYITLRSVIQEINYAHTYNTARLHFLSDPISDLAIVRLTKADTQHWIARQGHLNKSTKAKYLNVPRMAWAYALETLRLPMHSVNPFVKVGLKNVSQHRHRRLRAGEYDLLMTQIERPWHGAAMPDVCKRDLIDWAIETGMRREEITNVRPEHRSLCQRFLHIPKTKTGRKRDIPLTQKAQGIISKRLILGFNKRVFPYTPDRISRTFKRLCDGSGIVNLRFHDLRHECLSRLNELGLSPMDIMLVSGHTNVNELRTYVQVDRERVYKMLNPMELV